MQIYCNVTNRQRTKERDGANIMLQNGAGAKKGDDAN